MGSKEGPKLKLDTTLVSRLSFWYDISVSRGLAIKKYKNVKIIGENVRALQRGLTGDRTRIASGYMDEQSLLQAYLLYYWAVSLFEVTMVLEELDARARLPELHSVLDIGSGSSFFHCLKKCCAVCNITFTTLPINCPSTALVTKVINMITCKINLNI